MLHPAPPTPLFCRAANRTAFSVCTRLFRAAEGNDPSPIHFEAPVQRFRGYRSTVSRLPFNDVDATVQLYFEAPLQPFRGYRSTLFRWCRSTLFRGYRSTGQKINRGDTRYRATASGSATGSIFFETPPNYEQSRARSVERRVRCLGKQLLR